MLFSSVPFRTTFSNEKIQRKTFRSEQNTSMISQYVAQLVQVNYQAKVQFEISRFKYHQTPPRLLYAFPLHFLSFSHIPSIFCMNSLSSFSMMFSKHSQLSSSFLMNRYEAARSQMNLHVCASNTAN